MSDMIQVADVVITTEGGRTRYEAAVENSSSRSLWFEVPSRHADMVSDRADAFMLALLLPAMRTGQALHVRGPVTDELLHSLNGPAQAWVLSVLPMYQNVRVSSDEILAPSPPAGGVGTGFSAGVDSFSVLGDYLFAEDVPPSMRVTHLLFNDVGSHAGGPELAAVRLAGIRDLVKDWDVSLVDITSNVDDHFAGIGTNTAFMNTHTVRNASVAHLLGSGLGTWYYASGYAYRDLHGGPSDSTATSDMISLPLLSTSSSRLLSVGSERTRVEKTLQVATLTSAVKGLDVCTDGDPSRERNCSRCWKCLQTLMTLDVAGLLDDFCPGRFDRAVYLSHRDSYLVKALSSGYPHDREIIDFAETSGYTLHPKLRIAAAMRRSRGEAADMARRAKRRISSASSPLDKLRRARDREP